MIMFKLKRHGYYLSNDYLQHVKLSLMGIKNQCPHCVCSTDVAFLNNSSKDSELRKEIVHTCGSIDTFKFFLRTNVLRTKWSRKGDYCYTR